jgi:hypothetical protein
MARLGLMGHRVATLDTRRVQPPPKTVAPLYQTPEYREWQGKVIARAGGRCEAVDNGKRCWKAQPRNRMFADHVIEVTDGGAPFDVSNGQCLCGSHHTAKTARARAARHGAAPTIG